MVGDDANSGLEFLQQILLVILRPFKFILQVAQSGLHSVALHIVLAVHFGPLSLQFHYRVPEPLDFLIQLARLQHMLVIQLLDVQCVISHLFGQPLLKFLQSATRSLVTLSARCLLPIQLCL